MKYLLKKERLEKDRKKNNAAHNVFSARKIADIW